MGTEKAQKKITDVSVIVPVYNVEKYVARCLESLVNQKCDCSYEIIIINDGTKDNSMDIVNDYAARYNFIHVYTQENSGVSVARNNGITKACGKYVMFVDSDDYVSPSYISVLYNTAEAYGSDIAQCNYRNVFDSNDGGMNNFILHKKGVFEGKKVFGEVLMDITVRSYIWNKIYRRSLFTDNDIYFPQGMCFGEDISVMPQLFYYADKVSFANDTLYYYAHHEGSVTGSISKRDTISYLRAYASLRMFMESEDIFEQHRFIYYLLRKKISITIYGMLIRCWWRDPKNTHVLSTYKRTRKYLKACSSKKQSIRYATTELTTDK